MRKGALTCSSSSGSTFTMVLEKTCGVFLGWLRYNTHRQSVMNAMFTNELTAPSQTSFRMFWSSLAQCCRCSKQLPSRPSHPWRISPDWRKCGRVFEQVFCFLSRMGALGNSCSRFNIFGTAGVDAPPFDSCNTAHRVPVLTQVSFGAFRFPAQVDNPTGKPLACPRTVAMTIGSIFVNTCSSHVHIAKPSSLTTSWPAWVSRELPRWFVGRCECS